MLTVQVPLLSSPPFCDDDVIFGNSVIASGSSFLSFWIPGNPESRNWPLFYTIAWLLFRLLGSFTLPYHCLLLVLHAANGFLIFGIARNFRLRWPAIPAVLFWLHPVTAEPVSWIFQLLKLFACFLVLLFVYLSRGDSRLGTGRVAATVSLLVSLASSSYSHLLMLAHLIRSPWLGRRKGFAALLFAASAYGILLGICGTALMVNGARQAQVYEAIFRGEATEAGGPIYLAIDPGIMSQTVQAAKGYLLGSIGAPAAWKLAAVGLSSATYLKRIFLPSAQGLPRFTPCPGGLPFWLCFLAGAFVLGSAVVAVRKRDLLASAMLLTFLPVSGLFFFSWMNISLVADRLVYVPFAFFTLVLWRSLQRLSRRLLPAAGIAAALFLLYGSYERAAYLQRLYNQPIKRFFLNV